MCAENSDIAEYIDSGKCASGNEMYDFNSNAIES